MSDSLHRQVEARDRYGLPLSYAETQALRLYARTPDYQQAARSLGLSYSAFKGRMSRAFAKLGVPSAIDAYRQLGWLRVPPYDRRPA